jgi:glutathione S-transferase
MKDLKPMPEIQSKSQLLRDLKGIHLWHAPMSSCSQRVRIVLAETKKNYESHVINIAKNEHATEDYQTIHPNGLVPAIVIEGRLFIESIDIIGLLADDDSDLLLYHDVSLLKNADDAQMDLKLLSFEFLFKGTPIQIKEEFDEFQVNHNNDQLKQFRVDLSNGFERDRIEKAVARTHNHFQKLENILSDGRHFLGGAVYSLSDVAWAPNFHRCNLMNWPFQNTPYLRSWFNRVSKRESFELGLLSWENKDVMKNLDSYTRQSKALRRDIRAFGTLANF